MLLPVPSKYRHRRRPRLRPVAMPPPPGALVLVSAEYEIDVGVTLSFGRAIDIAQLQASEIVVDDGERELLFEGSGASLLAADTVLIELAPAGEAPPSSLVLLSASGATGIVAAGDGAPWAGVTGLALPFG